MGLWSQIWNQILTSTLSALLDWLSHFRYHQFPQLRNGDKNCYSIRSVDRVKCDTSESTWNGIRHKTNSKMLVSFPLPLPSFCWRIPKRLTLKFHDFFGLNTECTSWREPHHSLSPSTTTLGKLSGASGLSLLLAPHMLQSNSKGLL